MTQHANAPRRPRFDSPTQKLGGGAGSGAGSSNGGGGGGGGKGSPVPFMLNLLEGLGAGTATGLTGDPSFIQGLHTAQQDARRRAFQQEERERDEIAEAARSGSASFLASPEVQRRMSALGMDPAIWAPIAQSAQRNRVMEEKQQGLAQQAALAQLQAARGGEARAQAGEARERESFVAEQPLRRARGEAVEAAFPTAQDIISPVPGAVAGGGNGFIAMPTQFARATERPPSRATPEQRALLGLPDVGARVREEDREERRVRLAETESALRQRAMRAELDAADTERLRQARLHGLRAALRAGPNALPESARGAVRQALAQLEAAAPDAERQQAADAQFALQVAQLYGIADPRLSMGLAQELRRGVPLSQASLNAISNVEQRAQLQALQGAAREAEGRVAEVTAPIRALVGRGREVPVPTEELITVVSGVNTDMGTNVLAPLVAAGREINEGWLAQHVHVVRDDRVMTLREAINRGLLNDTIQLGPFSLLVANGALRLTVGEAPAQGSGAAYTDLLTGEQHVAPPAPAQRGLGRSLERLLENIAEGAPAPGMLGR